MDATTEAKNLHLSKEKKIFVNKNLFSNPTIRPLPPKRTEEDRPTPKLSDEHSLVRENFLSSSKALKYKEEVANPPRIESPVVKSLFDYKDNQIYKDAQPSDSSKPPTTKPANPFANAVKSENPFKTS